MQGIFASTTSSSYLRKSRAERILTMQMRHLAPVEQHLSEIPSETADSPRRMYSDSRLSQPFLTLRTSAVHQLSVVTLQAILTSSDP